MRRARDARSSDKEMCELTTRRVVSNICTLSVFAGVGAAPMSATRYSEAENSVRECLKEVDEKTVDCAVFGATCRLVCVPTTGGNVPLCALACSGGVLLCATI